MPERREKKQHLGPGPCVPRSEQSDAERGQTAGLGSGGQGSAAAAGLRPEGGAAQVQPDDPGGGEHEGRRDRRRWTATQPRLECRRPEEKAGDGHSVVF